MNEVILVRALRLPLITAFTATMAIVLIAPFYRMQSATQEDHSKVATEAPPKSRPVTSPPAEESLPAEQVPPAPLAGSINVPSNVPSAPSEGALPRNSSEASDDPAPEAVARPLLPTPTAPLQAMGKGLGRLNRQVNPVHRSIAQAAGQMSAWIARRATATFEQDQAPAEPSPLLRPVTAPRSRGGPADDDRIVLRNPEENDLPVVFLVNNRVETLSPGKEFVVPDERATIRFDRGRSFGEMQLDLQEGVYDFTVSTNGWSLRRQEPSL